MGQLSVLKVIDRKHREKCAGPSQPPEKVIETDPKVDMVDVVPAYKKSLIDTNITILALQKKIN